MNQIKSAYESRSFYLGDIFITEHTPSEKPKGIFVLLHGFPAWVTKNYDVSEVLALEGYQVYIPHHQGLGQSRGVFRFSENIKTIRHLLTQIKEQHPDLDLSLLGHSWGGYLSLRHLDLITDRLILLAPLARFPNDQRRHTLISSRDLNTEADLSEYTLETLEKEFKQLEQDVNYGLLQEEASAPRSLLLYGTKDEVIPAYLIRDFATDAKSSRFETIVLEDDHRLSKRRPVLDKIRHWLRNT
jgi:alpha-beta hydrolase superfamily lysophospholipase